MSDKEKEIKSAVEKIKLAEANGNYDSLRKHLLEKRLSWYENNKESLNLNGSDVWKAYQLIILKYLKLNKNEVPVVYEDDKKIIWHSYNWCPIIDACKRIDIETAKVCKEGWEESVQKLIEKINPNLKFSRNYSTSRPHGKYCEEIVELID